MRQTIDGYQKEGNKWFGGADRIRTCDLLIANETLYQLSYDPAPKAAIQLRPSRLASKLIVCRDADEFSRDFTERRYRLRLMKLRGQVAALEIV
jgi:hypothetical protein